MAQPRAFVKNVVMDAHRTTITTVQGAFERAFQRALDRYTFPRVGYRKAKQGVFTEVRLPANA